MKTNKKLMHVAAMHAAIDMNSVKDLAERVVVYLPTLEVHNCKSNGFTLRQMKDANTPYNEITNGIVDALKDLLDNDLEATTDYIMDNYDIVYDPDAISVKHISDIIDYSTNGRLIYVEIDLW